MRRTYEGSRIAPLSSKSFWTLEKFPSQKIVTRPSSRMTGSMFWITRVPPKAPADSPQVVSVGAVWDGNFGAVSWVSGARDNSTAVDQITSFTQRSSALDILAPGAMITSTYLHNTFMQMAGTSMASPVVAGSAVLMHQALDALGHSGQANQDTILSLMQSTGVTIVDKETAADKL